MVSKINVNRCECNEYFYCPFSLQLSDVGDAVHPAELSGGCSDDRGGLYDQCGLWQHLSIVWRHHQKGQVILLH